VGSFLAIGFINYLGFFYETALIFPSFASSAVVLFMTSRLTLRQVKSVLGGQILSALVGVTIYKIFGSSWWTISLGVSVAIVVMMLTDTIHPPGGATAFAAIILQQNYMFVVKPVFFGMALLILIALMIQFCVQLPPAEVGGLRHSCLSRLSVDTNPTCFSRWWLSYKRLNSIIRRN
jgi:CBS-domain-containing membrane protein